MRQRWEQFDAQAKNEIATCAVFAKKAVLQSNYSEKLVPQPQDALAFGLLTLNEAPIRSSTKSISEPARYCSDTGSISMVTPSRVDDDVVLGLVALDVELVLEAGAAAALTLSRSMAPDGSDLRISPIRRAARSVMVSRGHRLVIHVRPALR